MTVLIVDSAKAGYIKNYNFSNDQNGEIDFNFGSNVKEEKTTPEVQLDGIEL